MDNSIHYPMFGFPTTPSRDRVTVVTIVAVLHFAVLVAWLMQPSGTSMPQHVMEVTMAVAPATQHTPEPQPRKAVTAPTPLPVEPMAQESETPVAMPSVPEPIVAAVPAIKAVEAEAPVIEPDYKASYLNNQPPHYPLAARRMGLQGKVVLNVEVLAEGVSGQLNVFQSSGHEVLDRAALASVKTWRFVPARRAGLPFTRWFRVPIQFSLKENEA
ncbi:MAG: TonB family protein [Gallionella sp.]